LNTDGVVIRASDLSSCDGSLRDDGKFICTFVAKIRRCFMLEAPGNFSWFKIAWSRGFRHTQVFAHSSLAINLLNHECPTIHVQSNIVWC